MNKYLFFLSFAILTSPFLQHVQKGGHYGWQKKKQLWYPDGCNSYYPYRRTMAYLDFHQISEK